MEDTQYPRELALSVANIVNDGEVDPAIRQTVGALNGLVERLHSKLNTAETEAAAIKEALIDWLVIHEEGMRSREDAIRVYNSGRLPKVVQRCKEVVAHTTAGSTLLERLKTLEETLKPFAKMAGRFGSNERDDEAAWARGDGQTTTSITMGAFRKARTALKGDVPTP